MYSFAGLIRQTPQPTFSDTAITDRRSDTTIYTSSEYTGCGYPGPLNQKNRPDMCRRWELNPRLRGERQTSYPLGQALPFLLTKYCLFSGGNNGNVERVYRLYHIEFSKTRGQTV